MLIIVNCDRCKEKIIYDKPDHATNNRRFCESCVVKNKKEASKFTNSFSHCRVCLKVLKKIGAIACSNCYLDEYSASQMGSWDEEGQGHLL